jgi:hypothetical protein
MKNIKNILTIINTTNNFKQKFFIYLRLFISFVQFPAFVFHELCHSLLLIFCTDIKIKEYNFLKINNNNKNLQTYGLRISYNSTKKVGLLSSAMPLIGWLVLFIISLINCYWLILIYCIISFRMFYLSSVDIESMDNCGCDKRLTKILKYINTNIQKLSNKYYII